MKLRKAIKQKQFGKLLKSIFGAYSLDLTPSNFHPFLGLYDILGGQWFNEEILKNAVTNFFERKDQVWYAAGINKLIYWYEKCLVRYGDNVEKLVITWRIKFFWFEVHLLIFCGKRISHAKLLTYSSYNQFRSSWNFQRGYSVGWKEWKSEFGNHVASSNVRWCVWTKIKSK